ncbi:dTDP-4-dehydrorhamnose reductase [bacterium HR36]|uniref:dTDP-4-dehydrorhamnose reductase n=1 Tax=uncultured Planctomycetota bacterium TaxID=120965 RepID=H5S871_9BACT|nr:dTDP-4-dehydrorhamnose reductase [uncultured Planctomycetota bacterium]GBD37657.1 dTDP-4-dehydrorhamnose reductase [bacterium HR36]
MAKYLILGRTGQLGQAFAQRLGGEAVALSRAELDLAAGGLATEVLAAYRPQVVLNCAAYNHVDQAEQEPQQAFAVNALGVRELARACEKRGVFLVHFSTDYVFGLETGRRHPYTENDQPGPVNVYGVSKLAGEYFVRSITPYHLIVRTCGLYGRPGQGGKRTNFVELILHQAATTPILHVVADQVCSPTCVPDLVDAVLQCLERGLTGLVHLANEGAVSWYEFAQGILQVARLSVELRPISWRDRPSLARRPEYSALASMRQDAPRLRYWQFALQDYLATRAAAGWHS